MAGKTGIRTAFGKLKAKAKTVKELMDKIDSVKQANEVTDAIKDL